MMHVYRCKQRTVDHISALKTALPEALCCVPCKSLSDSLRPLDCSPPGSPGHGISQARILEWVAISHSRGSSQPRDGTRVSYVSCIGRKVLDHLSYQGSLLKPSSGINPRRSRDSNVKGEATGSLEANVECTHLLDAGKALHKSSNKPRKILIVTVILSCLFIKRGHQKSESEPKDGRRWSQHTKLMKRKCLGYTKGFRDFTKNVGGVAPEPRQLRGCVRWAHSQFPCASAGIIAKLSHTESACVQVSLGKDGGGGGRTLTETSTF